MTPEEKSREVYPLIHCDDWDKEQELVAQQLDRRVAFVCGYETAEKDLALTPDDIKLITKIHYEIVFKDTTGIKVGDVASEVLTRFKQYKEESHD